eukprot:1448781-Alexandrium_andersonii.AAC.1
MEPRPLGSSNPIRTGAFVLRRFAPLPRISRAGESSPARPMGSRPLGALPDAMEPPALLARNSSLPAVLNDRAGEFPLTRPMGSEPLGPPANGG